MLDHACNMHGVWCSPLSARAWVVDPNPLPGSNKLKEDVLVREFYQIFGKSGNKFPTKKFLHQYVC